jgi:diguanylate cyclase (GGDEF)-like protein
MPDSVPGLAAWFFRRGEVEWGVPFFVRRGKSTMQRVILSIGAGTLALTSATAALSPPNEFTAPVRTAMVVSAVAAVLYALRLWIMPLPGSGGATVAALVSTAGISAACLDHPSAAVGLAGTALLLLISVFITFYCNPTTHLAHALVAATVILILTVRLAAGGTDQAALAISKGAGPMVLVLMVFPVCHYVFSLLGSDALVAHDDPLTRLANRRGLTTFAEASAKPGRHMTAVLVDIDDFKSINDTYGHAVGDTVLVQVANRIADLAAKLKSQNLNVISARTGGEEFVMIIDTGLDSARAVATDLCAVIADHISPPVTVSIGVSVTTVTECWDLEELISTADRAMYRAKTRGGNQVAAEGDQPTSVDDLAPVWVLPQESVPGGDGVVDDPGGTTGGEMPLLRDDGVPGILGGLDTGVKDPEPGTRRRRQKRHSRRRGQDA